MVPDCQELVIRRTFIDCRLKFLGNASKRTSSESGHDRALPNGDHGAHEHSQSEEYVDTLCRNAETLTAWSPPAYHNAGNTDREDDADFEHKAEGRTSREPRHCQLDSRANCNADNVVDLDERARFQELFVSRTFIECRFVEQAASSAKRSCSEPCYSRAVLCSLHDDDKCFLSDDYGEALSCNAEAFRDAVCATKPGKISLESSPRISSHTMSTEPGDDSPARDLRRNSSSESLSSDSSSDADFEGYLQMAQRLNKPQLACRKIGDGVAFASRQLQWR